MSYIKRLKRSLRGCKPKLSLCLCLFEEGFCFDFFGYLISLPFLDKYAYLPHEIMESWGVYYYMNSIVFCWGRKTYHYYTFWDWKHQKNKHVILQKDGSWAPYIADYDGGNRSNDWKSVYDYTYILNNGDIQKRKATVTVEKREWRRKFLQWTPFFGKREKYIEIMFDDEVGERTGSWKGGCIGCSYKMKSDETPEQTLRRMEKERKFK